VFLLAPETRGRVTGAVQRDAARPKDCRSTGFPGPESLVAWWICPEGVGDDDHGEQPILENSTVCQISRCQTPVVGGASSPPRWDSFGKTDGLTSVLARFIGAHVAPLHEVGTPARQRVAI